MEKLNVGILIFENIEVLDFAGPFEVFSRTRLTPGTMSRRSEDSAPFNVFTVAETSQTVIATGGLQIIPSYNFASSPKIDILVVPGGLGTRPLLENNSILDWINTVSQEAQLITSVCTDALLLAKAGLLRNRRATTHWGALDILQELESSINVEHKARVVDDGIVTSAGVAAGIDMSLGRGLGNGFRSLRKLCRIDVSGHIRTG